MIPVDGDIYIADIPYEKNLESGRRPVIIAQNIKGNTHAPIIHVIPITSKVHKAKTQATHVFLEKNKGNGLKQDSVALVENCRAIPQECLTKKVGRLNECERAAIGKAFRVHFPLVG